MKGELLKRLFRAIASSDTEAIDKLTYLVIEDERKKGHTLLANQLANITKKNHTDTLVKKNGSSNSSGLSLPAVFFDGTATGGNLQGLETLPTSKRFNTSLVTFIPREKLNPDYLLEDSCRIANPAQSFQALTVGSVASDYYQNPPSTSLAEKDRPSAFSCSGLGIFDAIKPEVVEYGGDIVTDNNNPPGLTTPQAVCPELVRATLNGGLPVACDKVGVSFSTGKVSHIAACLAAEFPNENCLLYRALIVQSARLPEWTKQSDVNLLHAIRTIGYGIPNLDRAMGNFPNRITLITRGEETIKARQARIYQVQLPSELRALGDEIEILLEITLSYKAQPRRTRRDRRRYLSIWLDWDCSKKGEDPDAFLDRKLKEYEAPEDVEKGESIFTWTLGKQKNHKSIKGISRSAGTIQKDWTVVKSYELREAFCIAVVGHEGWNNDPDAYAPYSLVVSFEAINADIPVYSPMVEAQIPLEVETQVRV